MSDPTATNESISFYPKHIDILKKIADKNKLKTKSASVQHCVEYYAKKHKHSFKRDTFMYLLVPVGFWLFSYYAMLSTTNLETILINKLLYFHELFILKSIFQVFTFFFLTMVGIGFYLLYTKYVKK